MEEAEMERAEQRGRSARDELIARAAARGRRPEAEAYFADKEQREAGSVEPTVPENDCPACRAYRDELVKRGAELQRLRAVARNTVETARLLGINFGPLADAVGML